jgi:hypothetical protein
MPEKFTPEEYQQLAESPADAPIVLEGDAAENAPEGVVEEPGEDS